MTSCHTHTQIITSVHPNTLCREQNGDCIIQQKQIFNALLRVTVHADNVHAGGVPTTCVQVRAGCGRKSLAHTTVITGKHSVRSGDCDSQWLSGAHLRQLTNRGRRVTKLHKDTRGNGPPVDCHIPPRRPSKAAHQKRPRTVKTRVGIITCLCYRLSAHPTHPQPQAGGAPYTRRELELQNFILQGL